VIQRQIEAIPARLRALVKEERDKALTTLENDAALAVGTITLALRGLHEQMEARLREEITSAETRARVAERRASDAATALEAGAGLVSGLRGIIDELRALRPAEPIAPPAPDPNERPTVEMKPSPDGGGDKPEEPNEEETTVMVNPAAALLSGLRLGGSPRSATPPLAPTSPRLRLLNPGPESRDDSDR